LTPKTAYKKVCNYLGENVAVKICRDYDRYYSFFVAAPGTDIDEPAFVGSAHFIVDKNTGKVYSSEDYNAPRLPFGYWEAVDLNLFQ